MDPRLRLTLTLLALPSLANNCRSVIEEEGPIMSQTAILSRCEIETMGPIVPEELSETGVAEGFLTDLTLKHVAMMAEPTTNLVAERLGLPRTLTEELLQQLYREKLIEVRVQTTVG